MEKMVVFSLNNEHYALSIMMVKEIIKSTKLNPIPGSNQYFEGITNLRGKIIPVINLGKRFALESLSSSTNSHIIIIESKNVVFGILVDEVSEIVTIAPESIQPVSETLAKKINITFLNGVILDKDRVILYLKAEELLSEDVISAVKEVTVEPNTSEQNNQAIN